MAKSKKNFIGSWAFLIGVILALIVGFMNDINPTVATILVVLGLIIGLLNVADEESMPFLMSGAVLIIAAGLGQGALDSVPNLGGILQALLTIFVPATILVAIRNVFSLAKN